MKPIVTLLLAGLLALPLPAQQWPQAPATSASLFTANNSAQTTLTAPVASSDTTINVASTAGFAVPTVLAIDSEIMVATAKTGTQFTVIRAAESTAGVSHASLAAVQGRITAGYHNALATELIAVENFMSKTWVTPRNYGAVGDGVTDDTTALTNWLNAIAGTGKMGYCSAGIYKITQPVLIKFNTWDGIYYPGMQILGDGGCVILDSITTANADALTLAENSPNGLGNGGWGSEKVFLQGMQFWRDQTLSQPTGALLRLWGIANFGLTNINCEGTNKYNNTLGNYKTCVDTTNSQISYIHGGFMNNCSGPCINDVALTAGGEIEISGAQIFSTNSDGIYAQANEIHVHGNQISGSDGNHQDQNIAIHLTQGAIATVFANHFETNATDVDVETGSVVTFHGNYSTGHRSFYALGTNSRVFAMNNTVLSGGVFDTGSGPHILVNNNDWHPIIDHTGCNLTQYGNIFFSDGGFSPACPSAFPDAASFTSRATTAGDIGAFNPNYTGAYNGNWGIRVNGSNTGTTYLAFNPSGPAVSETSGDNTHLDILSGVAGTAWAKFRAQGTYAGHFQSFSTPITCGTTTTGAGNGSTCSIAANSSDTAMILTLNTGTSPQPGFQVLTVQLANAYDHTAIAQCSPVPNPTDLATVYPLYLDQGFLSSSYFSLATVGTLPASTTLKYSCIVSGY